MGFRVASSETTKSLKPSVRFRGVRGEGEDDEFEQMKQLFEGIMGEGEGGEGFEEIDWEALWDSFLGETTEAYEGGYGQPQETQDMRLRQGISPFSSRSYYS